MSRRVVQWCSCGEWGWADDDEWPWQCDSCKDRDELLRMSALERYTQRELDTDEVWDRR